MVNNQNDLKMNPNAVQVLSPIRNKHSFNWKKVWIGTGEYVALKIQEEDKYSSFILPNSHEEKFQKWIDKYLYNLIFKRIKRRVNESKRIKLACLDSLQRTVGRIRSLSPQVQSPLKTKEFTRHQPKQKINWFISDANGPRLMQNHDKLLNIFKLGEIWYLLWTILFE